MKNPAFYTKVDMRSRSEMVGFLIDHDRYHTMNCWNGQTSISNCIKLHNLDLPPDVSDVAYDALDCQELFDDIRCVLDKFGEDYRWNYQIGTNGRSGGYLVLYQGGVEDLGYKSRCRKCGQLNYTAVDPAVEPWGRCGKCGQLARANLKEPIKRRYTTGKGYGSDWYREDMLDKREWDFNTLKEEVRFIQSFDKACSDYVDAFIQWCRDNITDLATSA